MSSKDSRWRLYYRRADWLVCYKPRLFASIQIIKGGSVIDICIKPRSIILMECIIVENAITETNIRNERKYTR